MKRLFVLALLCPLFCVTYGQDVIAFNGETVTPQSSRLLKVKDSTNLWGIELQDGESVEFKLVSENTKVFYYTVNRKCVQGSYNNTLSYFNEIPHARQKVNTNGREAFKDQPAFWQSAKLLLTKDSLPLEIKTKNGEKIIARFVLREKPKYESFDTIDNKQFREESALKDYISSKLIKEQDNAIKVSDFSILLQRDGKYIPITDSIPKGLLEKNEDSVLFKVVLDVDYADGSKNRMDIGTIVVIKGKGLSFLDKIILGTMVILIMIVIIICIVKRKDLKEYLGHFIEWLRCKSHPAPGTAPNSTSNTAPNSTSDTNPNSTSDTNPNSTSDTAPNSTSDTNPNPNQDPDPGVLELQKRISELDAENERLKIDLDAYKKDSVSKKELRNKIEGLISEKNKIIREKQGVERELANTLSKVTSLETKVNEKDVKIIEINRQKDEVESKLRIEKNTKATLQKRIESFSKQTYYLYAIDDTLQAVDDSLKTIFRNVHDDNLMKRLAQPVLSGTTGLDAGLESYLLEWKGNVFDHQSQFFGANVLSLSDESVKEKMTEFLEQIALRDSFGKLVRLYLLTNVGWINTKMVAAGFDVDAIQTLFARFKNLFQLFNIEISYPHLFVDKFDSNLHKDNMRCEIFNYFEPTEELMSQLKNRENENLIVDVTRIGIPNSKTPTRRYAMVSLPNF